MLLEPSLKEGRLSTSKMARWIERRTGWRSVLAQRGWKCLRKLGNNSQVPRHSPLGLPRTNFRRPSFAEWVIDEGYIVAVTDIA